MKSDDRPRVTRAEFDRVVSAMSHVIKSAGLTYTVCYYLATQEFDVADINIDILQAVKARAKTMPFGRPSAVFRESVWLDVYRKCAGLHPLRQYS